MRPLPLACNAGYPLLRKTIPRAEPAGTQSGFESGPAGARLAVLAAVVRLCATGEKRVAHTLCASESAVLNYFPQPVKRATSSSPWRSRGITAALPVREHR